MTIRCFIIGYPISHSRSPLIHGRWLAEYGLDGSYETVEVAPEALPAFVARLRAGEFAGGNVTVPHKEAILPLLDHVGETARRMGAVNTVWRAEDGSLHGDNTDAFGFLAHLDASAPGWDGKAETALVIGAGGAARAVIHGLIDRRVGRILLTNRSPERAVALAREFGSQPGSQVEPLAWDSRSALVGRADLIVNTTSLGMKGQPPLAIDLAEMRPGTVVDDIVYVPLDTPLLAEARRRGGVPVDGLGMLLHQAVPGFERWFGRRPVVTPALRDLVAADIPKTS